MATASGSMSQKDTQKAAKQGGEAPSNRDELIEATLFRLTQGLPRRELKLIISEADACEQELEKDMQVLEQALEGKTDETAVDAIVDSLLTPMDRYWTASALLGRLRDDLSVPRIPTAANSLPTASPLPNASSASALISLADHPTYTQKHKNTSNLLALYKKIASNRAAAVFKRPVKPEEAPGYTDRILFPMDLSLLRKMIVARQITSYAEMHQHLGLISHNCVKFNGRESDYGLVAREFEAMADEAVRQFVLSGGRPTSTVPQKRSSSTTSQPAPGGSTAVPATTGAPAPPG